MKVQNSWCFFSVAPLMVNMSIGIYQDRPKVGTSFAAVLFKQGCTDFLSHANTIFLHTFLLPVLSQSWGQLHGWHQSGASHASPSSRTSSTWEPQSWPTRVRRRIRRRRSAARHRTLQSALLLWRWEETRWSAHFWSPRGTQTAAVQSQAVKNSWPLGCDIPRLLGDMWCSHWSS